MDVFSATLSSAQALAYALSVVKSLTECHAALRYGRGYLCDEQANVGHLQEIITQLKHRSILDPYLRSLLQSINSTVHDLLLLVNQRKRLQLVILLVIRRTEVNESFALLERKKNTLILYLTTQNSITIASLRTGNLPRSTKNLEMASEVRVRTKSSNSVTTASLKTGNLPHSTQNLEMASEVRVRTKSSNSVTTASLKTGNLPHSTQDLEVASEVCVRTKSSFLTLTLLQDSTCGSESGAGEKETVHDPFHANSPGLLALKDSSTTPTFVTKANKASGRGRQKIFAPTCQEIEALYEENETDGNATQIIGVVDIVSSLRQKEHLDGMTKQKEDVLGKKRFLFSAKHNKAVQSAVQKIFVPQHQTSNITHEGNISEDHAHQDIGEDPNAWTKKETRSLFRRAKSSKAQR